MFVFAVDPVELVAPHFFQVTRVDETVAVGGFFDEHHRRQVVEVPVGRDLYQVSFFAAHQRFHPGVGVLAVVDLGPGVALAHVVGVEVVVHQAVVVLDAFFQQQLVGDLAEFPPRRDVAGRAFAGDLGDQLDGFIEDDFLLLGGHGDGVFVAVAVHADFVAGVGHGLHLLGEGFHRVARDKPSGAQAVAFEQFEQARRADFTGEQAARDVIGRVFATIGTEPAGDRVNVDAKCTENVFSHGVSP